MKWYHHVQTEEETWYWANRVGFIAEIRGCKIGRGPHMKGPVGPVKNFVLRVLGSHLFELGS